MQEKHGRAQVSTCVIIIFMNRCRNEVDLILSRASMFAPLRNVSMFNSLFVGGALRDHANYSRSSHDVTKIQPKFLLWCGITPEGEGGTRYILGWGGVARPLIP